jgi:hypothetical protein
MWKNNVQHESMEEDHSNNDIFQPSFGPMIIMTCLMHPRSLELPKRKFFSILCASTCAPGTWGWEKQPSDLFFKPKLVEKT